MSDPSAHPERVRAMDNHPADGGMVTTVNRHAEVYGGGPPPFADRPCDTSIEKFKVANVPGVHPTDDQFRVVVKIARFDTYTDAQDAAAMIARILTGEDRTSV